MQADECSSTEPGSEHPLQLSSDAAVTRPVLSLRGLTKRYGASVAIDDVSLDVASGEFLALLGPSGSGKTSILMAIAGFVAPERGEILCRGTRIDTLPPERRGFGVVFQGYALFPHMTVLGNVSYPLVLRGMRKSEVRERAARALELVQLGHLASRLPHELSGGQQQRVALARALVFEPPIVLLDEPLSALDKKLRAELQHELKELHKKSGATFISVTHDQEEAMVMADRIAIMRAGKIVQSGAPQELYHLPQTRFVADFLGRATFLRGAVEGVKHQAIAVRVHDKLVHGHSPEEGMRPGQNVLLALRPERVMVSHGQATAEDDNRMVGEVTLASFLGVHHFYTVATPVGSVMSLMSSFGSGPLREVGSTVTVSWSLEAAIAVAEGT